MRGNVLPNRQQPAAPVDPPPPGRPRPAPPRGRPPDHRQGLHRAGRQDVPAVDVPDPDLRQLRQGRPDGTPADPDRYDYQRAARDALHFAALFDRFIQNLRRFLGYDVQYFAAVEPQRRLAPHVHIAIRGTVSRAELRQVIAATYHQVWWPSTDKVALRRRPACPSGTRHSGSYLDPDTGEVLPTWDEALDAIGDRRRAAARGPVRRPVRRPGRPGRVEGCEPVHRLPHQVPDQAPRRLPPGQTDAQADHADRLADALRYEPCSPTCANWLRYGIQPKNPRPGLRPGACKGKAHRREHLGYAGRRVLVSRKWSGKTLADHRADRKAWLTGNARSSGNRPGPLHLGTRQPRRPRPHAHRPAAPARRRRPHPLASRTRPGREEPAARPARSFGNREGSMMRRREAGLTAC